ncbi:DegT/DnrJ/EryC1/StrS family aminotransferase [Candidatus Woesearchaeota archaeon]|nr:DegT/DnrJ/EryC1/StrS family aminotransferase [Candidatus Woesearchaeota archaeon]
MKIPLVDLKAQYLAIRNEIDSAIQEIIDNTSFIMGPPVKRFEQSLAKFCECRHAVGVGSGSSALFLALKAYDIKKGDEVITVPNSFIATAEAVVQAGATPVFVDVDEKTMLMDPSRLEAAITKKTRAIIPVHLYGQICDMDLIIKMAEKHNLIILEDAAQAIDAEYKGKKIPVHKTAIFSFFPAKNLGAYGDGGAVVTHDNAVAQKVAKLRDHGRTSKYESDIIGYGERLDALQAAILDVKLKHLPEWTRKRGESAAKYTELLKDVKQVEPPFEEKHSKHVYYMYEIRVKNKKRDELMSFLKEKNIFAGIHYPVPLHVQQSLAYLGYKKGDFPVTEKAADEILSLPMYPELTEEQIKLVVAGIKEFFKVK